ncbi:MAG: hypothetical protein ACTSPU_01815 [Promethearchaeota archaeon]|jgi:hypothetical protein
MTLEKYKKIKVVCEKMSMYRSFLLKNNFWSKKGNEKDENFKGEKVYIKHDSEIGGIYAIVNSKRKGVKIIVNGEEHWFNNFDKLDSFLGKLKQREDDFMKILRRKNLSKRLRKLEI